MPIPGPLARDATEGEAPRGESPTARRKLLDHRDLVERFDVLKMAVGDNMSVALPEWPTHWIPDK
jgi:hypothetical protein